MSKPRLHDVDRAKGLAILLVVLGHIVAREPPVGNDWYVLLKAAIYQFHMPFFMFLCGLVLGYRFEAPRCLAEYRSFVARKFVRLVPAYVLFGVLVVGGKIAAASLLHVDNPPEGFWAGLAGVLVRPASSAASSLWFIYVLFAYYVVVPMGLRATGDRAGIVLAAAFALHFVPATDLFLLDRMAEYLPYFVLGIFSARHYEDYTGLVDRHGAAFAGGFGLALALFTFTAGFPEPLVAAAPVVTSKLAVGLLSIPALHGLVRHTGLARSEFLLILGRYTFPIYLMNTIAIGLAKGLMLRFVPWDGGAFLLYAPVLLAAGILVPIAARKLILARVPVLAQITA
jgi:fucose 4-O-acetylase-like acetyltransferase